MSELPIRTSLDDVEVKPVAGQELLSLYGQILRLLTREKDAQDLMHFFAEPQVNKIHQVIKWHTKALGDVRRFSELSVDRQREAMAQVDQTCRRVQQICNDLIKAQGAHSQNVVALKAMLVTPRLQDSLFLVGDRVVLTQWGCYPKGQRPTDFDLEIQGKQQVAKLLPPIEKIDEQPSTNDPTPQRGGVDQSAPVERQTVHEVAEPTVDKPKDDKPEVVEGKQPEEEEKKPEEQEIQPEGEEKGPLTKPEKKRWYWRWLLLLLLLLFLVLGLLLKKWTYVPKYDAALEAAYRAEIAQLWLKVDEKAKTCTPVVPPTPPMPEPPKVQDLTPEAMERGDLGVFNGSWRLVTDLFSSETKEKIVVDLSFDGTGKGRASTSEAGGRVCSGVASVSIGSANQFTVKDNGQRCNSGNSYSPGVYECRVRSDRRTADCRVSCVNSQGKDMMCETRFERK
jgi:hypothetical protein